MRLDVLSWLNKTTLDIIGLAGLLGFDSYIINLTGISGFDYSFNSLNTERPTELATAFGATMQATVTLSAFDIIPAWVPALRACVSRRINEIALTAHCPICSPRNSRSWGGPLRKP
jgi:hypothetical protein